MPIDLAFSKDDKYLDISNSPQNSLKISSQICFIHLENITPNFKKVDLKYLTKD